MTDQQLFYLIIFLDSIYVDLLIFGDKPNFKPYFIRFLVSFRNIRISKGNAPDNYSINDFVYKMGTQSWESNRSDIFIGSVYDSAEELNRKRELSAKKMQSERESARRYMYELNYKLMKTEQQLGRWRLLVKVLGLVAITLNLYYIVDR